MRRRTDRRDDRGVVLILVAVAMLAVLVIAAMAIDLGSKRSNRRGDQTVADLASLSAAYFLAGNGGTVVAPNAFLACKGAVESAKANVPDFTPTQDVDTTCSVFPTDARAACSASTAPIERTFSDATYSLVIRFPIPDSELADARFSGPGVNDGTNRCERMRVTFSRTAATGFARIIGVNEQTTEASSVIRATTSQVSQGVAALLLLERVGCGSLQNSGQGSVLVRSPSATNPGVIQADSAGQVGPCTTNSNAGGFVVYGPSLPASAGGGPSIIAETSANGTPGIIGIYSLGLLPAGRGGAVYPGGLSVAPVRAPISSRQPVDDKYNGTSSQIEDLHSTAYARTVWSPSTATSNGYALIQGNNPCKGNGIPAAALTAAKVFIDCDTFEPGSTLLPNATDVIARGNINIKNGQTLSLPQVRSFFVRGCGSSCGGGNNFALAIAGNLLVNTGEAALTADPYADGVTCNSRRAPSTTNWSQIATFSGEVAISGQARLCQTMLYMGTNTATYTRQAVTSTGVAPESYPSLTQCSAALPCPKDGVSTSWPFSVTGGGSGTDWTAPNQLSTQPTPTDFATYPFEDLALWNETSSINVAMKGQAGSLTEGVFFLPNASATFQGQGTQPILLNAQFLIRKLNMSGQGSLTLSPNPADSVLTPIPGAVAIIR